MIVIWIVVIPLMILGAIGAYFTLKSRNRSPLFLLMCLTGPLGWIFIWYLPAAPAREATSMQKYLESQGIKL